MSALCGALSEVVVCTDLGGSLVFMNATGRALFGLTPEAPLGGRTLGDFLRGPSWELVQRDGLPTVAREGSWRAEVLARTPEGRELPMQLMIVAKQAPDVPLHGYLCMLRDLSAQKLAEAGTLEVLRALRQSEERFAAAFHNAPFGVALSDLADQRYLDVNDSYCRLFGLRRDQFLGRSSIELGFWADPAERDEVVALLRASGSVRDYEVTGFRADRRPLVCMLSADLVTISGRPCVISTLRDITAQRRMQEALRESEERYRTLVEQSPDAILVHRPDRIELVNQAALALLGATQPAEVLGRPALELVHPADRANWEQRHGALGERARPVPLEQLRLLRLDGRTVDVEVLTSGIPFAGERAAMTILRDVTQRRAAEAAWRESEARYRIITEQTGQLIYDYDLASGRIRWEGAVARVTGCAPEEFAATDIDRWEELIHPEDRAAIVAQRQRARLAHERFRATYRLRRREGDYATVEENGVFLAEAGGRAGRMLGTLSDISERVRLEEQLRHAQKMESVGRLAGGVAHDFNNLLTVIFGHVNLLLDRSGVPADVRESVEQIEHAGTMAAGLTRQLLTISRRQALRPGPLNLPEVIGSMSRLLARTMGESVRLDVSTDGAVPVVHADRGMVEQVLLNLAVTARDAMPRGGRLTITTRVQVVDEAYRRRVPDARPGRWACMEVSDTGQGIAADVRPRIFEPFFTTKEAGKGTGLGLATVYGIVQQHGGWIEVESAPGVGACFRVFMPEAPGAGAAGAASTPAALPSGGPETILLVEDEEPVRRLIERVLTRQGYKVIAFGSGPLALEWWQTKDVWVDLLISDVMLPDGMEGPELVEELRKKSDRLRVLYVSGYSADSLGPIDPARGEYFLHKPFEMAALLRAVRHAVQGAGAPV